MELLAIFQKVKSMLIYIFLRFYNIYIIIKAKSKRKNYFLSRFTTYKD